MSTRNVLGVVLAIALSGAAATPRFSQEAVRLLPSERTLAERMAWAFEEASQRGYKTEFWAGYSIRRLMGEKSCIGTIHSGSGAKATLAEIISGKRGEFPALSNEEGARHQSRRILDDLEKKGEPEKKVWKDVAILFCYGKTAKKALNIIKRFHPL